MYQYVNVEPTMNSRVKILKIKFFHGKFRNLKILSINFFCMSFGIPDRGYGPPRASLATPL